MVEFVSYDGKWPSLCCGTLVLHIDGVEVNLSDAMASGGSVWFDEDWNEHVDCGVWNVEVPNEYLYLIDEINECVNQHVPFGCCGGCV